jgi:hypothetical protein
MDWIFDHLQLVIAAAGAIAWWLNQRRKGGAEGDETEPRPQETTFDDPELAERTRKIREEIQRKIAERARGYPNEQPTLPLEVPEEPPLVREVVVTQAPPMPRRGLTALEAQRQAEILEEQASLAERLKEAEQMKLAAQKRARYEASTTDHAGAARSLSRSTVLDDLRDPAALRRAFILREVLGPPVALRR